MEWLGFGSGYIDELNWGKYIVHYVTNVNSLEEPCMTFASSVVELMSYNRV